MCFSYCVRGHSRKGWRAHFLRSCVFMSVSPCVSDRIHKYVYCWIHMHVYTPSLWYAHACAHDAKRTRSHTHTNTHIHTQTHTSHTHKYTHTHTHTHTPTFMHTHSFSLTHTHKHAHGCAPPHTRTNPRTHLCHIHVHLCASMCVSVPVRCARVSVW